MAKVEIDNVKMWESLMKNKSGFQNICVLDIINALSDQGLTVDFDKIVSIEQKAELKLAHWYMCTSMIYPKFDRGKVYEIGELLTSAWENKEAFYSHFRPATEDEINKHLFVKEEMEHIKGYREKALKMLDKIEKECEEEIKGNNEGISLNAPAPQRDNYDEIKQAESKQENIPTFKELERNGKDELSEFEQMLVNLILRTEKTILTPDRLAKEFAPKLMNLARKQIASEIDVDNMADYVKETFKGVFDRDDLVLYVKAYRQGIEDTINKIKEG